jgi:hypothetical protein
MIREQRSCYLPAWLPRSRVLDFSEDDADFKEIDSDIMKSKPRFQVTSSVHLGLEAEILHWSQ